MYVIIQIALVLLSLTFAFLIFDHFTPKDEREYLDERRQRPFITDEEFVARFYCKSSVSHEIPIRMRHLVATQLNLHKIFPYDTISAILPDIDFSDFVLFDVAEEFNISITSDDIIHLDGSFDSLVNLVERKQ